jgi:hypothetical protein
MGAVGRESANVLGAENAVSERDAGRQKEKPGREASEEDAGSVHARLSILPVMGSAIVSLLPDGLRERLRAAKSSWTDARDWNAYSRTPTIPPPHVVKARTVLECAGRHGIDVLIETGTFEGEMARKCRGAFGQIHTIELDAGLAERAARRLGRWPWIHVHTGDSATLLPPLLERIREPILFWLDGHYSGEGTAHGAKETPLSEEIESIAERRRPGDVVLVDDARLLGTGTYPTLDAIRARLAVAHPAYRLSLSDDILRWEPAAAS